VVNRVGALDVLPLSFYIVAGRVVLLKCSYQLLVPNYQVSIPVQIAHRKLILVRPRPFCAENDDVKQMVELFNVYSSHFADIAWVRARIFSCNYVALQDCLQRLFFEDFGQQL
jgi:hypothetical protein